VNLRLRLALEWLAIGLLATTFVICAMLWRGTAAFDYLVYDNLSAVSRPPPDKNILIIAIDDNSMATLGQWPWDRKVHAQLLKKLQGLGARSISFDILLSESSETESDSEFAEAMAGSTPVFLPLHFNSPGNDGREFDTIRPAAPFMSKSSGVGHVNVSFDKDGIVRRTALCFQADTNEPKWPHLIELAYRAGGKSQSPASARTTQCGQELLLPYAERGSFAEISYVDVLSNTVPSGLINGRDVIIGSTAQGMGDSFPVPNGEGGLLSGVEIMANMLGALRRDDFVRPLDDAWVVAISLLPLWLLLIGFLRWRPRVILAMSLLSLVAIFSVSTVMLAMRIWFPPGGALLGVLFVYPLWGWRRLQAMSDFMSSELTALENEERTRTLPISSNRSIDLVGRQSDALAGAIDHMRDLRRFVADTLADLPDPMFVSDPEGKVTLTNRMLDERLGCSIEGTNIEAALDKIVAAEHRTLVDDYLNENPVHQGSHFVRFVSPLGHTFVMRRSEVRSDAGLLRGHIHYLTDISTLAKAEAEREEVLQLLSHDMRAPQSTIIALLGGEMDDDVKRRIERNARKTMQLAQDFVDIARMTQTDFDGEEILLAELMHDSADTYWPLANERSIRIVVTDNSDGGFVIAETDTLCRAIANLLDNAIKFSPNGSTISIIVERVIVDNTQWLSASIADQGPGIAADMLPQLFTRFSTGGSHHGRAKGTGLGLNFVQAVIAHHRGTMRGENRDLQGARFIIELPEAIGD